MEMAVQGLWLTIEDVYSACIISSGNRKIAFMNRRLKIAGYAAIIGAIGGVINAFIWDLIGKQSFLMMIIEGMLVNVGALLTSGCLSQIHFKEVLFPRP